MNAQKIAQEVVDRYTAGLSEYATHSENVAKHLRGPVQAVTLFILQDDEDEKQPPEIMPPPSIEEEEKKSAAADWRDYLAPGGNETSGDLPDLTALNVEAYEGLCRRTKARLEAFLAGVSLAVANEEGASSVLAMAPVSEVAVGTQRPDDSVRSSISLDQGLAGFTQGLGLGSQEAKRASGRSARIEAPRRGVVRSISSQSSSGQRLPQISLKDLVTRLELYIRSLYRVKAQGEQCVVTAEPTRAMKARVRSVVAAFVDTVDTVHQQSQVLSPLITCMAQELLAVEVLSDKLCKLIHQLVSDYVQSVSFASLAFLSTPATSAEQRLTPMLMRFLRYVQSNWRDCVAECELERMLSLVIDGDLRYTFKNIEFHSIGHLLEVCQGFRHELRHMEIAPDMRVEQECVTDGEAVRQAIRDLQREVITVNGNVLPPVQSRRDLISLLSQTLNSRTLTTAPIKTRRKSRKASVRRSMREAAANLRDESSGADTDISSSSFAESTSEKESPAKGRGHLRRGSSRRSFRLSTIDFFTKRLLLAASRTGTGGDAYFVVRDLFGGNEVEVVPSERVHPGQNRVGGPGTIEILVRLASVTIKCHGSFDVYPKSMVGECEPLIQLHTTTSETIAIHELRACDSMSDDGIIKDHHCEDEDDSESEHNGSVMVVQEKKTDRTGWRTLSIRPALYEKYEEFSTPS